MTHQYRQVPATFQASENVKTSHDDKEDPNSTLRESFEAEPQTVISLLPDNLIEGCSNDLLAQRVPIFKWAPHYDLPTLGHDLIAGLTVGLTAIPQGIAYAVVAGLQPQYGLYAAFMGSFTYAIFGSCKDLTIGPTAIMALMTRPYVEAYGPPLAFLLAFLTGVVILVFGILRLGFLVQFISLPVTAGFTSAAAITIASSQIKNLLGLPGNPRSFIESWTNVYLNISLIRPWDALLGVGTFVILVLAKNLKESSSKWPQDSPLQKFIKQLCSFLGLARNAIVVVAGAALAYSLSLKGLSPFKLTGTVDSGLPPFGLPPFSMMKGNETLTFLEMTEVLGSSLLAVPLISILETIAIAKAFAKGKTVDATQEMIALGLSNVFGSFVRSFPVTGSFTRTAVNCASGVVTPAGGVFTGALVLLSLSFLTSTFYFIPKATLAGLILNAMFYMVEYHAVIMLWRTKKADLVPLFTTVLMCLFVGLEYGMIVGITVNLMFILYHTARPEVSSEWLWVQDVEILLITPNERLSFPSADHLTTTILEHCVQPRESTTTVVIDGSRVLSVDATVAKGLRTTIKELDAMPQRVVLWRWRKSTMENLLGCDPSIAKYFRFDDDLIMLVDSM